MTNPPWAAPVRGNLRFVSTYRDDTHEAIAKAFAGEFEHARGVSALESVRYKLDPVMVALVETVRPALLEREMERKKARAATEEVAGICCPRTSALRASLAVGLFICGTAAISVVASIRSLI